MSITITMRKFFIVTGIFFTFYSCSEKSQTKQNHLLLEKMNWLIGAWKNVSADSEIYEIWNRQDDSTFIGGSYIIVKGDTVFTEAIFLESRNGNLFYIPVIHGQNDEAPVSFRFISDKNGGFNFENKEHDFPQRIIYVNPSPDSLYARIEGMQKGEFRKEEFSMNREK